MRLALFRPEADGEEQTSDFKMGKTNLFSPHAASGEGFPDKNLHVTNPDEVTISPVDVLRGGGAF